MKKKKIIRVSSVSISLNLLLKGQLKFLQKYYEVYGVASPDKDLEIVEKREGINVKGIPIKRNISIFSDIKSLILLYQFFKKEKPLIVHSITPKAGLLSMIASFLARVPIRMHTFTGLIFPTRKRLMKQILIAMDKLLCMFATNVYPEGNGVKNDLIKFKITRKPLKIIANGNINGINTTYYDPIEYTNQIKNDQKENLGIDSNDVVFTFIGRLVGDKGINELVIAFEQLRSIQKNVKLLLVGEEEKKIDSLKTDTLRIIEINPAIITTGWVDDIRPFLAITDVFVFPSYREGMPNVVLQAGAMGIPQIVTNINGSSEIIINGVNGLIIPVKNTKELYKTMNKMMNPITRNMLKTNARQLIAERYNQKVVWEALLDEYNLLTYELFEF